MSDHIKNNFFRALTKPRPWLRGLSIFNTINNIFTSSGSSRANVEKICTNCYRRTELEDKFCSRCGGALKPTTNTHSVNKDSSKKWYDTNWAWWSILLFWPVAIYAFYHRNGGEHKDKMIILLALLAISATMAIVDTFPDKKITTLSEGRAGKACFSMYLDSPLMARGFDLDFQRQITVKTGENEYSSVIYYTLDGFSRGFNCESIYLKDGSVWVSVYN